MASGNVNRLRAIFDITLVVGSIGVTILAVGTVVALFVWIYSLPGGSPQQFAAPQMPRPRAAPPPARPAPANAGSAPLAPSSNAAPVAAAEASAPPANAGPAAAAPNNPGPPPARAAAAVPQHVVAAPAQAGAAPPPPQGAPTFGPNSDATKNRAIGAGLARLAQDPEAQRKLGLGKAASVP